MKTSNALLEPESLNVVCQECDGTIDNISDAMKRTLKSFGQVIKGNKQAFMLSCTPCRANREVVMDQNNNTVCKTCHEPITIHAAFKMAMEEAGGLEKIDTSKETKKTTKAKKKVTRKKK